MSPHRPLAVTSALSGFLAVALGAVGAHALKHGLLAGATDAAQRLEWWETGARYHLVHALALGLAALVAQASKPARVAGGLFLAGTLLFSGSLYLMALTGALGWAKATPLGGVAFMAGWLALAWSAWKAPQAAKS